jgi:hypothetical protein
MASFHGLFGKAGLKDAKLQSHDPLPHGAGDKKPLVEHFYLLVLYQKLERTAFNAAKSVGALCSKGILRREHDRYVFEDVLFGRWVKQLV